MTTFQQEHHYNLRRVDTGEYCYEAIKAQWNKRHPTWFQAPGSKTSPWGLVATVLTSYPLTFMLFACLAIALSAIGFVNAEIMKLALDQLEHQSPDNPFLTKLQSTRKLVGILLFSQVGLTVIQSQNQFILSLLTERIKHGVNGLVFYKVMRKSIQRDPTFSIGQITNLTQVDVRKLSILANFLNRMTVAPLEIIGGLIWIRYLVGNIAFLGLAIILLSMFINLRLSKKFKMIKAKFMSSKDKRAKLVNEVFSNIRFIKMGGLENVFFQKMIKVKKEELSWLLRNFSVSCATMILGAGTPPFFLAALFGGHIYFHGKLTVSLIFTVMQIYNIFKSNFNSLPFLFAWVLDLTVSCERLTLFLLSENIDTSYIRRVEADKDESGYAVEISNGSFYWEDAELKELYQMEKDRISMNAQKSKSKKDRKEVKRDPSRITVSKERKAMVALRLQVSNVSVKGKKSLVGNSGRASLLSVASLGLTKKNFGDDDDFTNYSKLSEKLTKYADDDGLNEPLMAKEVPELRDIYSGIKFNLKHINLKIPKGKCVAVIGKVGSGKSSLLSCLSGEMYNKMGASIKIAGTTAHVSQKAWIPSATLKECVSFGDEYKQKRFDEAIKYSCMTDDLKILAKGAETLLGDKGVNLSGGQKIRLSIARAMYSDRDVYLFDDPISALDIHVGKYVMEEGIIGYLKGKTRVVATHALAYLPLFDYIYVMDQGEIVEEGTYEEIIETTVYKDLAGSIKKQKEAEVKKKMEEEDKKKEKPKVIEFPEIEENEEKLAKEKESETAQASEKDEREESEKEEEDKAVEDIIKAEDRVKGSLSWSVVTQWLGLIGGTPRILLLTILLSIVSLTRVGAPFFLQYWATNFSDTKMSKFDQLKTFLSIYMGISLLQILAHGARVYLVLQGNVELSREVNFMMTFKLMHASVNKYFDRVPMGRLLNRFLKDVQVIDSVMGWTSSTFSNSL